MSGGPRPLVKTAQASAARKGSQEEPETAGGCGWDETSRKTVAGPAGGHRWEGLLATGEVKGRPRRSLRGEGPSGSSRLSPALHVFSEVCARTTHTLTNTTVPKGR